MNTAIDMSSGRDRPPDTDIHVLCVDTDETVRERLASHLDTDHVRTVTSPRAAVDLVRDDADSVDCVVSEYRLPEMDGLAFLEAVRSTAATLPFVLFTGTGSEAIASEAISAGVTDYVRKDRDSPYDYLADRVTDVVAERADRTRRDGHPGRRAAAVEVAMDGIAILDEANEYIYANLAHADLYGYDSLDDIVGKTWYFLHDADGRRLDEEILPVIGEWGHWRGEAVGTRTDGTTFPQELSLSALPDGGLVCVVRDITDRTERERELEAIQRRYELVVRASTDAFWDWNLQTNEITRSEDYLRQFGYEPADIGSGVDWWVERIHPDDRDRVLSALDRALGDPDRKYDETYRFQRKDGTYGNVRSRGYVVYDEAGEPARMVGAHIDITETTEHEWAVQALHDAARAMVQASDRQVVADLTVEAARDALGLPVNALWLHEPEPDRLEPVAWTEEADDVVGQHPTYPGEEESLSWTVFETGLAQLIEDLRTHPGRYNPETPIRSEIIVPLGEHGVMNIGATEPDAFDQNDLVLARLLAANARSALDRIDRPEALRDRTITLEQQNQYLSEGYDLLLDPELAVERKCQEMLRLGCEYVGFEVGLLARLSGSTGTIEAVHAPEVPLVPGVTFDLPAPAEEIVPPADRSEAGVIHTPRAEGGVIHTPRAEGGVNHTPTADGDEPPALQAAFGFEAYLQVPVYVDQERYGLVAFGSPRPHDRPLEEGTVTLATFVTRWLDYELARQTRGAVGDQAHGIPERTEQVDLEPVDLSTALRSAVLSIRETDPEVTFETDIPPNVTVRANELLCEVLGTAITTAIEHDETEGPCVSVTVEEPDDADDPVTVRIADTGSGGPDDIEAVTVRREKTGPPPSQGSGFGRFVVDAMVAQYGGDTWIEDTDSGGATFVIELPAP